MFNPFPTKSAVVPGRLPHTNSPKDPKKPADEHMSYTVEQPSDELVVYGPRTLAQHVSGTQGLINTVCDQISTFFPLGTQGISKALCIKAAQHLLAAGKRVTVQGVYDMAKKMRGQKQQQQNKKASLSKKSPPPPRLVGGLGRTTAPVAVSRQIRRSSKPRMRVSGDTMCISHSEMIGTVMSGAPSSNITAFRCLGYRANPGISTVFPWLSSVAVNYEKYRFRRLSFTIVPLVATNWGGRIGVGFDYDSTDVVPGNRQEFYALTTHTENMPWEAASVEVRCDTTYKFTGTHTAADNKLIDQGQVIVMSDAISNGGTLSAAVPLYDLLVNYDVELIEPQQALFATQSFYGNTSLVAGNKLGVGTDTTVISGPSVVEDTSVTAGAVTFTMPAGTYSLVAFMNWSAGAAGFNVTCTTAGATLKATSASGTSFGYAVGTVSCTTEFVLSFNCTTVTYTANLNKFNVVLSRVASSVASGFFN